MSLQLHTTTIYEYDVTGTSKQTWYTTSKGIPCNMTAPTVRSNVQTAGIQPGSQPTKTAQITLYLETRSQGVPAVGNLYNPTEIPRRANIHHYYAMLDTHGLKYAWEMRVEDPHHSWYLINPDKGAQRRCWLHKDASAIGGVFTVLFSVPGHAGALYETAVAQVLHRASPMLVPCVALVLPGVPWCGKHY